ncbi:S-adenosyl-L-methionine-dependent methyltransferase [Glomus cerebriforme]|uniref:S-adenosyl-L-methionine-dependent methyltransferase n=1 Tax=Glomus cerebriforme TaxID=658196 RepID=A0A397TJT6_9GLOM|nr:S-adenosyl-L-methionine-dependent methyltransferase [Glomus cerebriforme]
MGNSISKKTKNNLNYSELFPSKSILENKEDYEELEHLGHGILREVFQGNFSSPIQNILLDPNAKILDVGCGTGFWLIEMASDFQKPNYFGIDILPIFPKSTFPSNIEFQQGNVLEGLPFEDNTFDFIHMQFLFCELTVFQWENFIFQEIARVLKPGGWLEICDPELEIINKGPMTKKFDMAGKYTVYI